MGDLSAAHNELVDAHMDLEDELKALRLKVTDLEDRSSRNMKLRGIPESVKPAELSSFLQQMTKTLPTLTPADVIDRAHRLHKLPHLHEKVPRDVIARIHFFHIKGQLMRFCRQNDTLSDPYAGITIYADLSQATMKSRNNLIPIRKMLRNHKMLYR